MMEGNDAGKRHAHRICGPKGLIVRSVVLGVLLVPALARGQSAGDLSFRVLDIKAYPGERVTTSVLFDNSGTHGVRGFQVALKLQGCSGVNLTDGIDPATEWFL